MCGGVPSLVSPEELVETLQGFQNPHSGLIPDPWQPPPSDDCPERLSDHVSRYHLLAVGYALELLGAHLRHPVYVVSSLIDGYATGIYVNLKRPLTLFWHIAATLSTLLLEKATLVMSLM